MKSDISTYLAPPVSMIARSKFEPPLVYEGVTLGPLVPVGPDLRMVSSHPLEHLRASSTDGLKNHASIIDPTKSGELMAGNTLWAGPFIAHFGHMLAEWVHRLWAETVFGPYDRIVFQVSPEEALPTWIVDVFRACGVDPKKVQSVATEHTFERLFVPKQGRVLGGVTLVPNYEDLFPLAAIPVDRAGSKYLYVSRSKVLTGSYEGEHEVETALERAGFKIIHPEMMPLADVLAVMRSASVIIFAEGSAIHNLELIGRIEAKVLVIGRRYGCRGRFLPLLKSLVKQRDFYGNIEVEGDTTRLDIPSLIDWIAGHTGLAIQPIT